MARNSELILCSGIRLDREYSNVIDYSESDMLSLCRTNKIAGDSNYSFIRNGKRLGTSIPYSAALQGNYIAFQNPDYSNKWFFGFVDDVKYVNDNSTEIFYTIDYFSTWFRELTLNDCMVVREHTNDDTIGANTMNEDLNVGEVIAESTDEFTFQDSQSLIPNDNYACILSTHDPATNKDFTGVEEINGSYFGYRAFLIDGHANVDNFIGKTNSQGKIDSILCIFMFPKTLIPSSDLSLVTDTYTTATYTYYRFIPVLGDTAHKEFESTKQITKTTSFTDLTIKNNKCYCYPYNYLMITNNAGNKNILRYENFSDTTANFKIQSSFSIGGSIRCVPSNYKGISENIDESIPLAKFPTCSWSGDAFTNWLTQNSVNIATNVLSTATGLLTGSAPVVMATAGQTANLIGQFYQASLLPSIEGGQNTGDVNYSSSDNTFKFIHMRAKNEYMKIIDDYFTAYGYKTMRNKIPNITGRTYWNFVEIGSSESIGHGSIPADALSVINNAFHNGVTIWHDHANIGNYELTNSIVTP